MQRRPPGWQLRRLRRQTQPYAGITSLYRSLVAVEAAHNNTIMIEPLANEKDSPPHSRWPYWLLRRTDQATVAVLVLLALVSMIAWWIYRGGLVGGIIELEQVPPQTANFQVDINSADWPELAQLPGVGRVLAEKIIKEREKNGPFADYDDLVRRVSGIGPKTLAQIRPYLLPLGAQPNSDDRPEAEDNH